MTALDRFNDRLRPRDERLIELLVEGKLPREAAEAVGVSVRTVRRRLRDPVFRAALDAATDEIRRAFARSLVEKGIAAAERMEARGEPADDAALLRASLAVLPSQSQITADIAVAAPSQWEQLGVTRAVVVRNAIDVEAEEYLHPDEEDPFAENYREPPALPTGEEPHETMNPVTDGRPQRRKH